MKPREVQVDKEYHVEDQDSIQNLETLRPAFFSIAMPGKRRSSGSTGAWKDVFSGSSKTVSTVDLSSHNSLSTSMISPGGSTSASDRPHTILEALRESSISLPPKKANISKKGANDASQPADQTTKRNPKLFPSCTVASKVASQSDPAKKTCQNKKQNLYSLDLSQRRFTPSAAQCQIQEDGADDDAPKLSSFPSMPQRRSTLTMDGNDHDCDDDDAGSAYSECSEDSNSDRDSTDRDQLGPLVDMHPRLEKSINPPHESTSFSASFGSISLRGDESMSSEDTFHNSPVAPMKEALTIHHKPNLSAHPIKKILKHNPDPNPIQWTRRRLQRPLPLDSEDSSTSSRSQTRSSSGTRGRQSRFTKSSLVAKSSSGTATSYEWEDALQTISQKKLKHSPYSGSFDSGCVSIATYSSNENESTESDFEDSSTEISANSRSCSEFEPSIQLGSIQEEKPGIEAQFEKGLVSTFSRDSEMLNDVKKEGPRSYSSWTSGDDSTTISEASDRFMQKFGDMETWESSSSSFNNMLKEVWDEEKAELAHHTTGTSEKPPEPRKPRSAYDKNAPWYCGDDGDEQINKFMNDGDDSINSDSSSVLSYLRRSKPAHKRVSETSTEESSLMFTEMFRSSLGLKKNRFTQQNDTGSKRSESSLSFSNLLGPDSEVTANAKPSPKQHSLLSAKLQQASEKSIAVHSLEQQMLEEWDLDAGLRSLKLDDMDDIEEGEEEESLSEGIKPHSRDGHHPTRTIESNISLDESTTTDETDDVEPSVRSKKWDELMKVIERPWFMRSLLIAFVIFLIMDIALVLAVAMT